MKELNKKIVAVLLALSIPVTPVMAAVSLNVDGVSQELANDVVLENGTTLAPMREIFEILGAKIDWDDKTDTITAVKGDQTIVLTIGETKALVNGQTVELSAAATIRGGVTYVPVRFIADALGYGVNWEPDAKAVVISTGTGSSQEAPGASDKPLADELKLVYDNQKYDQTITLDEAYEKAVKNNSDLKKLSNTLELMRKERDNMGTQMVYNTAYPEGVNVIDASIYSAVNQIYSLQQNIKDAPLSEKITKDVIRLSLISSFKNIKDYSIDLSLAQNALSVERQGLDNLELMLSLGMESEYNVEKARMNYAQSQENIRALELAIESEYIALNSLMGSSADSRYNIEYEMTYTPVGEVDLDNYVSRMTETDPKVKLARSALESAKFAMTVYSATGTESYDSKLNTQKEANRALEDEKEKLDKNIRTTYASIKQLESVIQGNELDLEKAKADYNTLLTQYETGAITALQVEQGALAVYQAEQALQKNLNTHHQLMLTFEYPYLIQ